MKTLKQFVVPYCVPKKEGWWTGIDFFNHSESSQVVEVNVFDETGKRCSQVNFELEAFESKVLTPDDLSKNVIVESGRAKVIIVATEELLITPFQGTDKGGFGILPVKESVDIKKP